jgi:hypothetical protein
VVNLTSSTLLNWCWRIRPAGVLAVGAGFRTEARRIGGVVDGQLFLGQDFILMDIGYRHFSRGNQKIIPVFQFEQVGFEFGQLAGVGHGLAVDDKRRQHLGVAVFAGMDSSMKLISARSSLAPAPI